MVEQERKEAERKKHFGIQLSALNENLFEEIVEIYRSIAGECSFGGFYREGHLPSIDSITHYLLKDGHDIIPLGSRLEQGTGIIISKQVPGIEGEPIARFQLWPDRGIIAFYKKELEEWMEEFESRTGQIFIQKGIAIEIDPFLFF